MSRRSRRRPAIKSAISRCPRPICHSRNPSARLGTGVSGKPGILYAVRCDGDGPIPDFAPKIGTASVNVAGMSGKLGILYGGYR